MSEPQAALAPELMAILVCPADQGELVAEADDVGLRCTICGRIYPVREGIPVMLLEEAAGAVAETSEGNGS